MRKLAKITAKFGQLSCEKLFEGIFGPTTSNFLMNPKEPESFFPIYNMHHKQAEDRRKELIEDAKKTADNNSFDFLFEACKRQHDVTKIAKDLHERVLVIENEWTNAQTMTDSHKQFQNTVDFFENTEPLVVEMSQELQNLSNDVVGCSVEK